MDEILERYKQGKFQKCLELIDLLPPPANIVDSFILQNCVLVIESVIKILKNNVQNTQETEEKLYLFFDSITSLNILDADVSLKLKLTATFNYFWWILFFNTSDIQENELCLKKINVGLIRIAGDDSNKFLNFPHLTILEKTFSQLYKLKNLIKSKNCCTSLLIAELILVILLIIFKCNKEMLQKCLSSIRFFLWDLKEIIKSTELKKKHVEKCNTSLEIFKFDLNKLTTMLSLTDFSVFDYLQFLESLSFFIVGNFEESLMSLQKNHNCSSLWNYLKAFNFYKLNKIDQCLKYLKKISALNVEIQLKMRILILKGKLNCQDKNYKKSLKNFEKALNLKTNSPLPYFYIGQQYGKMGLYELMAEWFEKFFKIVKDEKKKKSHNCNIEVVLLDCIHGSDEITETEAFYSLAISYGLNERFDEASNIFERILQSHRNTDLIDRVIYMPSWLTVLHEASLINLLAGNLARAENIASDAILQYSPQKISLIFREKKSFVFKDIQWLQRVVEEELLDYMALIVKKQNLDEVEKCTCNIVKALTSKICLWLVNPQVSNNNLIYIEKMFKRALGCNKGDKDVLYGYCDFLLKNGKIREASKLWNTYCNEETSVPLECIQSFCLRYFLDTKITKADMEKIKKKIKFNSVLSKS